MKNKPLAMLSPLCLSLFAGSAWADLEPFSFGASETVRHESNIAHGDGVTSAELGDWVSTTTVNGALKEAIGRNELVASAAVDYSHYKRSPHLSGTGYTGAAEFDWNTVGDLSGAFGADAHRRQYIYGVTADTTGTTGAASTSQRNMQTDSHGFARIALGGQARWTIFGGADFNQRDFSLDAFKSQEERQWSSNVGTRYSTSPDLSFGLVGAYTNGEYPHGALDGVSSAKFTSRSVNATTHLQASGNSSFDASLGYTSQDNDLVSRGRNFANGSLNWSWAPPSHFTVNLGLKRSSDVDSSTTGANVGDYTQRKDSDIALSQTQPVAGATRTSRLFLSAHYQPTRTTDLSCGGGREVRHADAALAGAGLGAYTDTTLQCMASIHFD